LGVWYVVLARDILDLDFFSVSPPRSLTPSAVCVDVTIAADGDNFTNSMLNEVKICSVSARLSLFTPQTTSRLRVNWVHPVGLWGNKRLFGLCDFFGPLYPVFTAKATPKGGLSITITQSSQCGHQQYNRRFNPVLAT
jgi:hypothetical protein